MHFLDNHLDVYVTCSPPIPHTFCLSFLIHSPSHCPTFPSSSPSFLFTPPPLPLSSLLPLSPPLLSPFPSQGIKPWPLMADELQENQTGTTCNHVAHLHTSECIQAFVLHSSLYPPLSPLLLISPPPSLSSSPLSPSSSPSPLCDRRELASA